MPGHSQRKDLSPGPVDCYVQRFHSLKYVKGASCVTQLSCVPSVTSAGNVVSNLPVGARLQNFWQAWLDLGSGPNLERGLHPPLSDLTEAYKVSHGRKLLCQSSQEQLPVRGITSAYRQTCCRASKKSNFLGVFQPSFSGSQTQQQVETHTGPQQSKSILQGRKIQNGDPRNHQDIPPTRGVGHIHRFQRHLLPHTYTGAVQKISQVPCSGSDLPIQSTAFRSVHGTLGVHCGSKRGETDGHLEGYKNPPVPRRLVSEGQIPPGLSPAYSS